MKRLSDSVTNILRRERQTIKRAEKKSQKKLPDTLHELIRLAVKDVILVEQTKGMSIYMNTWLEGNDGGCTMCFAGAIIRKEFKMTAEEFAMLENDIDDFAESHKFEALNQIRCYEIYRALRDFYFGNPDFDLIIESKKPNLATFTEMQDMFREMGLEYVSYHTDSKVFKKHMLLIADELEKRGL